MQASPGLAPARRTTHSSLPGHHLPPGCLQYLQYVGDRLLEVLGHPPAYGAKASPFGWLEGIAKK